MAHTTPGAAEKLVEDTRKISAQLSLDPRGGSDGKVKFIQLKMR